MSQTATQAQRLPAQPRNGLVVSARVLVDGSDTEAGDDGREYRWTEGFAWRPEDCRGGGAIGPCTFDGSFGQSDPNNENADARTFMPVVLEAASICSTFGSRLTEERDRARRKLMANTSRLLEYELATGTAADNEIGVNALFGDNARLEDTGATLIHAGAAVGYVTALAELEQRLADLLSSQDRMIHAMPRLVTHWVENGLVKRDGNLLRTELGTIVVAGSGYPGRNPSGSAPAADQDRSWAYGTDAVVVRLGQIWSPEATDQAAYTFGTNTLRVRAYRFAAATFDCGPIAVQVDLTTARTTTGS